MNTNARKGKNETKTEIISKTLKRKQEITLKKLPSSEQLIVSRGSPNDIHQS